MFNNGPIPRNNEEEILSRLYNLILNPDTKGFERKLLLPYKAKLEEKGNFLGVLTQLEKELWPYAIKEELSSKVAQFYVDISLYKNGKGLGRGLITLGGVH